MQRPPRTKGSMGSGTGEEAPNCGNGLEAEARVDAKAVRRRGQYGVATALAADDLERSDRHRGADASPPVTRLGRDVLNLGGSRSVEYACRRNDIAVDETQQVLEPGARPGVGRAANLRNAADERVVAAPGQDPHPDADVLEIPGTADMHVDRRRVARL